MKNPELSRERPKSMPCDSTEKSIPELKKEGWENEWSFHARFPEQWDDACDKVEKLQRDGFWECVLVPGQDEMEKRDGVAYIFKRKTDKYRQYEKDRGYIK